MSSQIITNAAIRLYLQDKPQYNSLLDGVRWSEEMINEAVSNTVAYYNETNPPANVFYTVEGFPFKYTLLTGVAGYLLRSASIQQASNHLTYSEDDITIDDDDKAAIFAQLGKTFWDEFKELAFNQKTNANVLACYGNKSSEWRQRAFTT